MDIRNCVKCGEIFKFKGDERCLNCVDGSPSSFQKVRNFLYLNPGANIEKVSKNTGVKVTEITSFLKQDRIGIKSKRDIKINNKN